jgi:hypothetical protein
MQGPVSAAVDPEWARMGLARRSEWLLHLQLFASGSKSRAIKGRCALPLVQCSMVPLRGNVVLRDRIFIDIMNLRPGAAVGAGQPGRQPHARRRRG